MTLPAIRTGDPVALLEEGTRLLEQAVTADEAMHVRAVASAAAAYARQAKLGLEAENYGAELRVRAERRTGELLATREPNRGGRPPETRDHTSPVSPPTLTELGIDRKQSERFQAVAAVPEPEFEEYVTSTKEAGGRITSTGARMAVHYSSATDQWATPQALFDVLNAEFGFTLDVCASRENAKCPEFYSEAEDGLAQPWTGTCWMNPPYGDAIPKWIGKARESGDAGATVVCLVPARTDTGWWWDHCRYGEVRFLRGRLKFGDSATSAPFPNAVVVFGRPERVVWWEWKP